jgi:hypothetical protein
MIPANEGQLAPIVAEAWVCIKIMTGGDDFFRSLAAGINCHQMIQGGNAWLVLLLDENEPIPLRLAAPIGVAQRADMLRLRAERNRRLTRFQPVQTLIAGVGKVNHALVDSESPTPVFMNFCAYAIFTRKDGMSLHPMTSVKQVVSALLVAPQFPPIDMSVCDP